MLSTQFQTKACDVVEPVARCGGGEHHMSCATLYFWLNVKGGRVLLANTTMNVQTCADNPLSNLGL
jgi:hypothetical protein